MGGLGGRRGTGALSTGRVWPLSAGVGGGWSLGHSCWVGSLGHIARQGSLGQTTDWSPGPGAGGRAGVPGAQQAGRGSLGHRPGGPGAEHSLCHAVGPACPLGLAYCPGSRRGFAVVSDAPTSPCPAPPRRLACSYHAGCLVAGPGRRSQAAQHPEASSPMWASCGLGGSACRASPCRDTPHPLRVWSPAGSGWRPGVPAPSRNRIWRRGTPSTEGLSHWARLPRARFCVGCWCTVLREWSPPEQWAPQEPPLCLQEY